VTAIKRALAVSPNTSSPKSATPTIEELNSVAPDTPVLRDGAIMKVQQT
jgi:hypothetical protein